MGLARLRGPFVCAGCAQEFHTRRSPTEANRFCSLACYRKNKTGNGRVNERAIELEAKRQVHACCDCGDAAIRLWAKRCKPCNRKHLRQRAREEIAKRIGTEKACKRCGANFPRKYTGGSAPDYCSEVCRTAVVSANARAHRTKRKAKLRALYRLEQSDSIDPIRIFERDKWMCQLCGMKTPKANRGTWLPNAPELDHIIPIASGGSHTIDNVQCSCRECNNLKRAKPLGQMLLRIA